MFMRSKRAVGLGMFGVILFDENPKTRGLYK